MSSTSNKEELISKDMVYPDEIDFLKIFRIIKRKKNIVISLSTLGILGGIFYGSFRDPLWKGEFQIVLDQENTSNKYNQLVSNQILRNLSNSNQENSLKTEVKILESNSVLQPVFNFVKDQYSNKYPKKNLGLNYKSWHKNFLKINLVNDTSVLEISYIEKEREFILPVLKKISLEYQNYSGRDRQKNISRGIKYLENQIKITREDSNKSLLKLQEFTSKYSLGNEAGIPLTNSDSLESSIEALDPSIGEPQRQIDQIQILRNLESQLVEMSTVMTPRSKIIKSLKERINAYKDSLSRPNITLIEYRNLQRDSSLKEKLLVKLEAELAALKLDNARKNDPWELISTPTLLESPVGLSKKIIILAGFIIGSISGLIFSILYEIYTGKLFEEDYFTEILSYPIIKKLSLKNKKLWNESIDLISKDILNSKNKKNIALIFLSGNEIESIKNRFIKNFKNKNRELFFKNNLLETDENSIIIPICVAGSITKEKLLQFKEDLAINKNEVKGLIFIGD